MNAPAAINRASRIPTTNERTGCRLFVRLFDPAPICAAPEAQPEEKIAHSSQSVPSSARLCGGHTVLTATVNLPTWRAPSPHIRARDTSLDGTTNGSAGVNSASDVDTGVNGATHLSRQRCRDHEDRGDSTNYRNLAEQNSSLPWLQLPFTRLNKQTSLAWDRGQGPQGRYSSSTDAPAELRAICFLTPPMPR